MNGNLREQGIRFQYRTDQDDILNEFYIPCLATSVRYDRAIGYFTSYGLSLAARGISGLVANGGKMRLLVGALINEEDSDAILEGYEERLRRNLANRLDSELAKIPSDIITKRLAMLAWLISNGQLEVKVAVRLDSVGRLCQGIYHEKIGIFMDKSEDEVAFSGSPNETQGGLVDNFESIEVFRSWMTGEELRVARKRTDFDRLWSNTTKKLLVLDFTDAVRAKLIRFRPDVAPVTDPEDSGDRSRLVQTGKPPLELYPFQRGSIDAWANNDFKGLLAMATGTGKTIVALRAVAEFVPESVHIVVLVPSLELADQWDRSISLEFPQARIVDCHSGIADWSDRLERLIDLTASEREGDTGRSFLVVTYQTASKAVFRRIVSRLNGRVCLIADEVHHAGAREFSRVLEINARYRIGLSATPTREWDEAGSELVERYFGGIVCNYDIASAIEDGKLSPYEYVIHSVDLDQSESSAYKELSHRIARAVANIVKNNPSLRTAPLWRILSSALASQDKHLRVLLYHRAAIVRHARHKIGILEDILRTNPSLGRCLVYCSDQAQTDEATRRIIELGFAAMQYTSKLSRAARKRALEALEQGMCNFLVAIRCLDEGVDIPVCDSAVILASSKSTREFVQRRGRLLRLHPSKKNSVIHDVVVVPQAGAGTLNEVESSFLESELHRADLFAKHALNRQGALEQIRRIRYQYSEIS